MLVSSTKKPSTCMSRDFVPLYGLMPLYVVFIAVRDENVGLIRFAQLDVLSDVVVDTRMYPRDDEARRSAGAEIMIRH